MQVDQLAILHYLPDIVQMQSALHEICNHRIDKNEAENINIERFLETYISKGSIFKNVYKNYPLFNRTSEK